MMRPNDKTNRKLKKVVRLSLTVELQNNKNVVTLSKFFTNSSTCSSFSGLSSYTFPVFLCAFIVSGNSLLINKLRYENGNLIALSSNVNKIIKFQLTTMFSVIYFNLFPVKSVDLWNLSGLRNLAFTKPDDYQMSEREKLLCS